MLPETTNPVSPLWTEALLTDLALGVSEDVILDVHGLQHHQLQALLFNPAFARQLETRRVELGKSGVSFELKAQIQADALLDTSWALIHNMDTPANVKADLIKHTVRWAGYDKASSAENGARSGLSININLGGVNPSANTQIVLNHEDD